jgi:hypothetical protein
MNDTPFFRFFVGLTGLLIFGEAAALLVGMHFLSGPGNLWISLKNDLLLAIDSITGEVLIYLISTQIEIKPSVGMYLLLGIAILSHIYRVWEFLKDSPQKFCINTPLFVVNDVKLTLLLVLTVILGKVIL